MKKLFAALLALFFVCASVWAESDDISSLYTFTPNTTIQSSQVNSQFNQIINTLNNKAGRGVNQTFTGVNTFSGNTTFSGEVTFSNSTNPISTDDINEYSDGAGLTIDGVLLKDDFINIARAAKTMASVDTGTDIVTMAASHGLTDADPIQFKTSGTLPAGLSTSTTYYVDVQSSTTFEVYTDSGLSSQVDITDSGSGTHTVDADPAVLTDGDIWYNATDDAFKGRANGSTVTFVTAASVGDYPTGYMSGGYLTYNSSTQVILPEGLVVRDDSDSVNIEVSSDITIDITTSTGTGVVNALMNGLTEGNSTWYHVWLIAKADGSDPAGILTTSSTTIATYPTNYTIKRYIGVVRNDSSGNFVPFYVTGGASNLQEYQYQLASTTYMASLVVGTTNVVSAGTSTTFTDVSLSAWQPPNSDIAILKVLVDDYRMAVRTDGTSNEGLYFGTGGANNFTGTAPFKLQTSSNTVEYKVSTSGTCYIDIMGFVLTLP